MAALDPAVRERVMAEATRRGVDPARAVREAERVAADDSAAPTRPIADRLLIGFLPFIRVRELRANWLGLDERIPDDDLTCAAFQLKYGAAPSATAPEADGG